MKRLLAALLAVVLFGSVFAAYIPMTVAADSLYIRKIVSVVYDDSESMKNYGSSNWAYASYAMQAFCGLLNSDDQLYITYMSEAEKNPNLNPPGIDLSASAIQSSVDSIRKHTAASNTPYNALDIAFNKLASVQDPDVNTQYWLVVITDGEFQSSSGGIVSEGELNSKLTSYASTVMPNNSTPRITYLAIGKNVTKPESKPDRGIFAYESSGAGDIVNVMAQAAAKSGKKEVTFKCKSKEVFEKAFNQLIAVGQDGYEVVRAASKANRKILGNSYSRRYDKNLWTLTLTFKYK